MPQLKPYQSPISSHVAASRPPSATLSTTSSRLRVSRVFTGQHLDDHAHYHKEGRQVDKQGKPRTTDSSSSFDSEKGDDDVSRSTAHREQIDFTDFREGIANEHDVEAPLEKVRSTKSKDPDLVCIVPKL